MSGIAREEMRKQKKYRCIIIIFFVILIFAACICLFSGSSGMTIKECVMALLKKGSGSNIRIIWKIRIPRMFAALIAGAGLSCAGLVMQTVLNNPMASPSTLGVSNAAVFGANLSIIVFAGGFLNTGNQVSNLMSYVNPYAAGTVAFLFSVASVFLILGLCRLKAFSPEVVVLSGIAIGSAWSAFTTILQYYATDVGISAAVVWNFGDLQRATAKTDWIMAGVVFSCYIIFRLLSWKYNALLSGEATAQSMGVNVSRLRFVSLLLASVVTAICVSSLGIIGFVGIICPHMAKKWVGQDHRYLIPVSALCGSILLVLSDTLAKWVGHGSAIPVGAVTALLGAPFFVFLIISGRERSC